MPGMLSADGRKSHWATTARGFPGGAGVKNLPANAGDIRDMGSIPGSGRSLGGEHGNSLQYSCLENHSDRGAWWATVHRIAKSWTRLKRPSMHALKHCKSSSPPQVHPHCCLEVLSKIGSFSMDYTYSEAFLLSNILVNHINTYTHKMVVIPALQGKY